MQTNDIVIIGGGIVGLATAYRLKQTHPDMSIVILEKESQVATHQTSHNSGVIHSGIFYEPNSLKAKNCRQGRKALIKFCERQGIAYEICGKVVVATSQQEEKELSRIEKKEGGLELSVNESDRSDSMSWNRTFEGLQLCMWLTVALSTTLLWPKRWPSEFGSTVGRFSLKRKCES
ncbi:L-2-hydroxyglutarate oxidase LhgO [Salinibacter ruber]|nr:L-2-hydroxyglutarate oxidase LhgO [Salinibacter ruber]